ncbi:hypothetical protein OIU84_019960 [Salix udensis]|uniref:MLO-like protein n=1 Tax=Salix udensis TaxID=889485 RepID=A0AAD6L040_9ROSI|nr:hypothetical protein OIU84_019960 [Salix udensis]
MASTGKARSLEQTPTWAVAVVCFVLVAISIVIEHLIHVVEKWLKKKHKTALAEALEKVKAELMLMGFISLLLTILQGPISDICIPENIAATWHPCSKNQEKQKVAEADDSDNSRRRLLQFLDSGESHRRFLASKYDKCAERGKVALVSSYGIHQLHIFIFVLAVVHVLYCIITYFLGRTKMRKWKAWEVETKTLEYQYHNDPERFRFARETSFGRRHMQLWSKSSILLWIKIQDTKSSEVEGLRIVSLFLTGWNSHFWLPFIPLINAFQMAFFIWSVYEFTIKSCYHAHTEGIVIRITLGVIIQIVCSYVTLPLYALVTQMGSSMRPTVFNNRVAAALKTWHQTAKKQSKHGRNSGSQTPMSSRPQTPSYGMSPAHLLQNFRGSTAPDSIQNSPRHSNYESKDQWDPEANSVHDYKHNESVHQESPDVRDQVQVIEIQDSNPVQLPSGPGPIHTQHEINAGSARDFTFRK